MAEEEEIEEDEESNENSFEDTQEILDEPPTTRFRSHSLSEIIPVLNQAESGNQKRGFQRFIIQEDDKEEEQVSYDIENQKKGERPQRNEYRPQDDYASSGDGNYSSSSESSQGTIGESRQVFGSRTPRGVETNWGENKMDSIGRDALSGNMNIGAGTQNKNYEDDPEKRMKDRKRTM